jgi:hypothetical protein
MTGEELDELSLKVAERVMGWTWFQRVNSKDAWLFPPGSHDSAEASRYPVFKRCGIVGPFEPYTDGVKHGAGPPARFAWEAETALEVVVVLTERFSWADVPVRLDFDGSEWTCKVGVDFGCADDPYESWMTSGRGPTLAVAVCDAAVNAPDRK